MNIVWLTPEIPYPPNTGGRIVMYNRIKQLKILGNQIHLITIVDNMNEVNLQEIGKICNTVKLINRKQTKLENLAKTFLFPYCVASRTSSKISDIVDSLIEKKKCDIVFCEFPQMAYNLLNLKNKGKCKLILSLHNIESETMHSLAKCMKSPLKKLIYDIEAKRLRKIEDKIVNNKVFDAICFVSDKDMIYFKQRYPDFCGMLWLSPIGADTHIIQNKTKEKNIILVGKMNYQPNIAGALWLVSKVIPTVLEEEPCVKLYIVGKDPTDEVRNLANDHIIVTGTVESVENYYNQAMIAVLPIFEGGGVKTKLIEAASYAMPIVSTTFGIKGTSFGKDNEIIIADTEDDFAKGILKCISDSKIRDEMRRKVYSNFIKLYTWSGIGLELQNKMNNL